MKSWGEHHDAPQKNGIYFDISLKLGNLWSFSHMWSHPYNGKLKNTTYSLFKGAHASEDFR